MQTLSARLKMVAVVSGAALVGINVWTGAPLLALWLGSQVPRQILSFWAVVTVVVSMMAIETVLLVALNMLNASYRRLAGIPEPKRARPSWLRSMRDTESAGDFAEPVRPLTTVERLLVANVVVAALLFEIWFFFFAHMTLVGGGAY